MKINLYFNFSKESFYAIALQNTGCNLTLKSPNTIALPVTIFFMFSYGICLRQRVYMFHKNNYTAVHSTNSIIFDLFLSFYQFIYEYVCKDRRWGHIQKIQWCISIVKYIRNEVGLLWVKPVQNLLLTNVQIIYHCIFKTCHTIVPTIIVDLFNKIWDLSGRQLTNSIKYVRFSCNYLNALIQPVHFTKQTYNL